LPNLAAGIRFLRPISPEFGKMAAEIIGEGLMSGTGGRGFKYRRSD
jgi:hypothetical protein